LELIKDYDLGINYHPSKANVVADALSRRSHVNMLATRELLPEFCKEFEKLNLGWVSSTEVVTMEVDSTLEQDIRKDQLEDAKIQEIKEQIKEDKALGFSADGQGTLWYKKCICVPEVKGIWELILQESLDSTYSIHLGSTKMYLDLKSRYWWYGMKRAISKYVALCDNCQRVKVEHQRPAWLLQPLKIPQWKWEEISMDFIVGLHTTQSGYDSIWVIVDRFSKVAHFISVMTTYKGAKLVELYIARIVCLHGVPKKIVSDRGTQFTSRFWEKLHEAKDTMLNFSSAYHPQTDGQTERVKQILEDMLRACALKDKKSWDKCLLKMSPFNVLYGCKCRTPLFWNEPGENQVFLTRNTSRGRKTSSSRQRKLKLAQSRQKIYANHRRRNLSFQVRDFISLKVSPMRGLHRFKIRGMLAPRYIGPFKILEQRGEVAYQLDLPPQLSEVYDVFHVSQLRKCLRVPEEQIPLEKWTVGEDLTYQEYRVKILDTSEKLTQNNCYKTCKVQWSNHAEEEAT
jgi:hypothetical protein